MGLDRSKFGSTSIKAIKQQDEELESIRPKSGGGGYTKTEIHKIEDGDNLFRIAPFHPDSESENFAEIKSVSFLPVEVPKRDDKGKPVEDETEIRRVPVYNAKVHGVDASGEALPLDLVDLYLKILKDELNSRYQDDSESFKKEWGIATGYNKTSIKPVDSWVAYAFKFDEDEEEWNFGMLEFKKSIRDGLNGLVASLDEDGEPLNVEPFTDPDEGLPIIITKNSNAKPADYYKVNFKTVTKKTGAGRVQQIEAVPLTDEQLEELMERDSLYKRYRGAFFASTLAKQIEGLRNFDDEHEFEIFDHPDFQEAMELMSELVLPDPEKEEEEAEEEVKEEKPKKSTRVTKTEKPKSSKAAKAKVEEEEAEEEYVPADVEDDEEDALAALKKRLGK